MTYKILFFYLIGLVISTSFKPNTDPDVYVAGQYGRQAVYWKNGVMHPLTTGENRARATSIFVERGDIYVLGLETTQDTLSTRIKYWKNGEATVLTSTSSSTLVNNQMLVKNLVVTSKDVYILGNYDSVHGYASWTMPCYWKNEKLHPVSPDKKIDAVAESIFVAGTDVYVAGFEQSYASELKALYWKNGVPMKLSAEKSQDLAHTIFVSGKDVYVAGEELTQPNHRAKYWKNGRAVLLSDGTKDAQVYSMYVSGNDVYVAGEIRDDNFRSEAVYWKNGQLVKLSDEKQDACAKSIRIFNKDVYISGYEMEGEHVAAKYWKNNKEVRLSDEKISAAAYSIFVTQ